MLIQDQMMRGPSNIRKIIATHLQAQVPGAIDILITQNTDLNHALLPYPKMYDAIDPLDTSEYPTFGAFVTGADRFEYTTVEPTGAIELDPIYEVTIFVTAKTALLKTDAAGLPVYEQPYRSSSIRMRDDLMAVLTNVILNYPSLGTAGTKYRTKVNTDTVRWALPEPIQDNGLWICSGLMNLSISYTETTVVPYYGDLQTINTDVVLTEN